MTQEFKKKNGMRAMVLPPHAFHPNAFIRSTHIQGYTGFPKNATDSIQNAD